CSPSVPRFTTTCASFFFFSSRRRHTRFSRDWSSDVCSSDLGAPFIAADVGGTHVRVGLVDGHDPSGFLQYRKYACADFAGLGEVLQAFLGTLGPGLAIDRGVLACAGHALDDGSLLSVNLPWPVVPARIREQLGFDDLRLVNDFEAVAHAVAAADAHSLLRLSGPARAMPGPTLVVGRGT